MQVGQAWKDWQHVWHFSLHWLHNGCDSVSNHQPHDCLHNRLFRRRSKETWKPRVTGLCVGNSPETGEFPAQMASNAENVSIWWRHHVSYISNVPKYAIMDQWQIGIDTVMMTSWHGSTRLSYYWPILRRIHRWPVDFPHKAPVMPSFHVFYNTSTDELLKKSSCRWLKTWSSCNVILILCPPCWLRFVTGQLWSKEGDLSHINSSPPGQSGCHFADDTLRCISVNEKFYIVIKISLKFVLMGPVDDNLALTYIMAWRRIGDKPLYKQCWPDSLTYICGSRRWVRMVMIIQKYMVWIYLVPMHFGNNICG